MSTTNQYKVLIVDDHPAVREGLELRIGIEDDLIVAGLAEDADEAFNLIGETQPDAAVVDISLKNSSGIELMSRVKKEYPKLRMLAFSMYDDAIYAERALRAGALGYVNKAQSMSELVEAIHDVIKGKIHVSREIADRVLARSAGRSKRGAMAANAGNVVDILSNRELEVFKFAGHGKDTAQISVIMQVSPKTVESFRARIKAKLGLQTSAELTRDATKWLLENGN